MKKTVILILAVLPIVLLITIAFAGRILSYYSHIPVEKVQFLNEDGTAEFPSNGIITLGVDEEYATKIIIYPELASDKHVIYESLDESVCSVDANGVIKGVGEGKAQVKAITHDQNKEDIIDVLVKQTHVTSVRLSHTELEMKVGERQTITATVEGPNAENRKVAFSSSDVSVIKVDPNGNITAMGVGTADVVVTTDEGDFTARCTVTVIQGMPPLAFDFTGAQGVEIQPSGVVLIKLVEINISQYLVIDSNLIDASQVVIKIQSGASNCTFDEETGIITAIKYERVIRIFAYVGSETQPTYSTEIRIVFNP